MSESLQAMSPPLIVSVKDDNFECYKEYESWIFTQKRRQIKKLRSVRGGEYLSGVFKTCSKSEDATSRCMTLEVSLMAWR
jgi:hypothetical protein